MKERKMMNKYQEAISNYFTAKLNFDNEMYKAMDLLEELADKETPMKIYRDKDEEPFCPRCKSNKRVMTFDSNTIFEEENDYCGECGQAILWEEE